MKKLIILTISIIFAVSTFNPAYGQRGKKSQGKTTKAQDSTTKLKAVDPVLQPEKTPVPDASVAAEIESLRTEFGKLKASVQKLEKSGKQTTKRINELKTQDATLNTSINSMKASLGKNYTEFLDSISKSSKSIAQLKIKAAANDTIAEQILMDLQKLETSKDELQESRARTKTIVGILLALIIIVLGVLFFIMWRQKEKMNETVARIDKIDPDHLGFRGASRNAHGDEVGSTGPTNYKTASTHN